MVSVFDMVHRTLLQTFCAHDFKEKTKGGHSYRKGGRELMFFRGTLKVCEKCGVERFIFIKGE